MWNALVGFDVAPFGWVLAGLATAVAVTITVLALRPRRRPAPTRAQRDYGKAA